MLKHWLSLVKLHPSFHCMRWFQSLFLNLVYLIFLSIIPSRKSKTLGLRSYCSSSKWVFDLQTQKCGSGIIADEDIKQGEFVIEYVGEGTFPNMVSNRHSKIFRCN